MYEFPTSPHHLPSVTYQHVWGEIHTARHLRCRLSSFHRLFFSLSLHQDEQWLISKCNIRQGRRLWREKKILWKALICVNGWGGLFLSGVRRKMSSRCFSLRGKRERTALNICKQCNHQTWSILTLVRPPLMKLSLLIEHKTGHSYSGASLVCSHVAFYSFLLSSTQLIHKKGARLMFCVIYTVCTNSEMELDFSLRCC